MKLSSFGVAVAVCVLTGPAASATVNIALVPVGDAGNANDSGTGLGQVNYTYSIGKCDVTATQYAPFLNAVAST
ncbi:MAG: PEP-CTERM sorting domain-containing protein, partial [Phycisphaerae bacterium]